MVKEMTKEMDVTHLLLLLLGAYLVYHFFLRGCIERFTPLDTIHTSLDESINKPLVIKPLVIKLSIIKKNKNNFLV